MGKKNVHRWCLSVDFNAGDGPAIFALNHRTRKQNEREMRSFWEYIGGGDTPPQVEIVGLTRPQWERARRNREKSAHS